VKKLTGGRGAHAAVSVSAANSPMNKD
jgi:hypothetical protein